MNKVYLSIGGNLGKRRANLAKAVFLISQQIGSIIALSDLYETKAWGIENQPDFLNQALIVETTLSPLQVLKNALAIETKMGRKRERKWYTRLIDIDLLFFEQQVIKTDDLTLPHPFLQERNFVLVPLAQIAPNFIHPISQKSIQELLKTCPDVLKVVKL